MHRCCVIIFFNLKIHLGKCLKFCIGIGIYFKKNNNKKIVKFKKHILIDFYLKA